MSSARSIGLLTISLLCITTKADASIVTLLPSAQYRFNLYSDVIIDVGNGGISQTSNKLDYELKARDLAIRDGKEAFGRASTNSKGQPYPYISAQATTKGLIDVSKSGATISLDYYFLINEAGFATHEKQLHANLLSYYVLKTQDAKAGISLKLTDLETSIQNTIQFINYDGTYESKRLLNTTFDFYTGRPYKFTLIASARAEGILSEAYAYIDPYIELTEPGFSIQFSDGIGNAPVSDPDLSPVPLPASAPMFGAALLAFGTVGYGVKRKKAATSA